MANKNFETLNAKNNTWNKMRKVTMFISLLKMLLNCDLYHLELGRFRYWNLFPNNMSKVAIVIQTVGRLKLIQVDEI